MKQESARAKSTAILAELFDRAPHFVQLATLTDCLKRSGRVTFSTQYFTCTMTRRSTQVSKAESMDGCQSRRPQPPGSCTHSSN